MNDKPKPEIKYDLAVQDGELAEKIYQFALLGMTTHAIATKLQTPVQKLKAWIIQGDRVQKKLHMGAMKMEDLTNEDRYCMLITQKYNEARADLEGQQLININRIAQKNQNLEAMKMLHKIGTENTSQQLITDKNGNQTDTSQINIQINLTKEEKQNLRQEIIKEYDLD